MNDITDFFSVLGFGVSVLFILGTLVGLLHLVTLAIKPSNNYTRRDDLKIGDFVKTNDGSLWEIIKFPDNIDFDHLCAKLVGSKHVLADLSADFKKVTIYNPIKRD